MNKIELAGLSEKYTVKKLGEKDVDIIFDLCRENDMFYQFHPPFVTKESIMEDMEALPPGSQRDDKFYTGFFDGDTLAAIMDFILGYPQEKVVYIGLFMMQKALQGKGTGTALIQGCSEYFARLGYAKIRLAVDEGNPQSRAFWEKNGFAENGIKVPNGESFYLVMERNLP